ncbi:MAG: hypothetical protein F7C33_01060 [Desulfurococcales archaeon]|nr:hypothetical protein [Desulfurococcales archaeon]
MQSSKNLEATFKNAIRIAKSLPQPEIGDDTIIAYSSGGKPPALNLYIALIQAGARATIAPASLVATSILPYRETGTVIAFSNSGRDARAINLLMAASSLGVKAYLVAPPLHPAVEDLVASLEAETITVESEATLLTMMIATLHWRPQLMGAREQRIQEEIEALPEAWEWIQERYSDVLGAAQDDVPARAYYSPLMEAAAQYHTLASGKPSYELEDSLLIEARGERPLLFLSSVEAYNYKDILLGLAMRGVRPLRVEVNTDPVTANIYASIIAGIISGRLE